MSSSALREDKNYSKAMNLAIEVLNSMPTVTAFNGQNAELQRYNLALQSTTYDCVMKSVYIGAAFAATFFIMFASLGLAFWVGTDFIVDKGLRPETLITVFFSVMMGSLALGRAGPQFTAIRTAQIAASKFQDCFIPETSIKRSSFLDTSQQEYLSNVPPKISIKNGSFSYPTRPDLPVLTDFSMDVNSGESVALVGKSGAGKSTVFALLLKLYSPSSGKIKIDEQNVENLNSSYLRRHIFGFVGQEPVLFNTTIMNNLKWACDHTPTDEEVFEACRKAQVDKFVSRLPQGYNTVIGGSSSGVSLSGGEKQRIAIARALLKKASILLLDEATSALDSENESFIQEAIEQDAQKKITKIVIAHRLSTVKNADKIFVLDEGKVVEMGSHQTLMQNKGVYFSMVESSKFFVDDGEIYKDTKKTEGVRTILRNNGLKNEKLKPCEDAEKQSLLDEIEDPKLETKHAPQDSSENLLTGTKRLQLELEQVRGKPSTFLKIIRHASPEWKFLSGGILFCFIQGSVFPIFSLFFSNIIETFALLDLDEKRSTGHFWALMLLVLGIIQAVSIFGQAALFGLSSESFVRRLRVQLFGHLLCMDTEFLIVPPTLLQECAPVLLRIQPLLNRVPSHLWMAIDYRLGSVCVSFISLFCGLALALYYGWQMTVFLLLLFPLGLAGQSLQAKYLKSKAKKDAMEFETAGIIALEAVSNMRTVKAMAMEDKLAELFDECLAKILKRSRWRGFAQALSYGFASCTYYFLYSASFYFAIWLIMEKVLLPMDVLRTLFAISFTAGTFGFAGSYFPELIKAKFAAGLVFKILNQQPKILKNSLYGQGTHAKSVQTKPSEMSIIVQNVDFIYPQRPQFQVFNKLNICVEAGRIVGLVGLSGCGKSTLVQLLLRLYDPTAGTIMIGGIDLRDWDPITLRAAIGWVDQEPVLFNRSIRDNICYGLEDEDKSSKEKVFEKKVSHEAIVQAMKMANIDEFVLGLPQVYVILAERRGYVFPVLYALLLNKTQAAYERLFEMIKGMWPEFSPTSISVDFEMAVINAIEVCFLDSEVWGCLFHLVQNLKKKLGKKGLKGRYDTDPDFAVLCSKNLFPVLCHSSVLVRCFLWMITAMAFVPPDDVMPVFEELWDMLPLELEPILLWMQKNYIGSVTRRDVFIAPRFSHSLWNVYERTLNGSHRTNNFAEAANHRLQVELDVCHPGLWKFINSLRTVQQGRDQKFIQWQAGKRPKGKRTKYVEADRRILTIVQDYENRSTEEFLKGIANNFEMED